MKSFLDPANPTHTKTPLQNRRINGLSSARRSTPHKARYLPYRGDSPHIGKRTGITISPVPRDEDGFEPFEEVLKQVDMQHTAWLRGRHILEALNENRERQGGGEEENRRKDCSSNNLKSRTGTSPMFGAYSHLRVTFSPFLWNRSHLQIENTPNSYPDPWFSAMVAGAREFSTALPVGTKHSDKQGRRRLYGGDSGAVGRAAETE
ncbi:hypothetical protein NMY22_g11811 [Coprinellus aureogranulatus]|nr:hypothetical protein NMY22_g11811 [Coprinellus aureogranulatus]